MPGNNTYTALSISCLLLSLWCSLVLVHYTGVYQACVPWYPYLLAGCTCLPPLRAEHFWHCLLLLHCTGDPRSAPQSSLYPRRMGWIWTPRGLSFSQGVRGVPQDLVPGGQLVAMLVKLQARHLLHASASCRGPFLKQERIRTHLTVPPLSTHVNLN